MTWCSVLLALCETLFGLRLQQKHIRRSWTTGGPKQLETARRLKRRIRLVHTPKNGSWLNMAEMELSLLSRRCLGDRRFAAAAMDTEITAWQADRNTCHCGTNWRFTTNDARIKLKSLYPIPDTER